MTKTGDDKDRKKLVQDRQMFHAGNGMWSSAENTPLQKQYLSIEAQVTGLLYYDDARHLLLMLYLPRFQKEWSNDSSRPEGTPNNDMFVINFFLNRHS